MERGCISTISNDILVEDAVADKRYLVEGWNGVPGVPKHLACLTGLVCLTDADEAAVFPLTTAPNQTRARNERKRGYVRG